jgi:hypothetical protein
MWLEGLRKVGEARVLSDTYSERPSIYLGPYIPSDQRREPVRGAVSLHQSVVDSVIPVQQPASCIRARQSVTKMIFMCRANRGRGNGNLVRIVYRSWNGENNIARIGSSETVLDV